MSALGSGLATIAAPLFVAAHTGNPLTVSLTAGVAWLPWLLFALPGGVLADRVDRRRLMVVIDWVRVAAMGVLATAILTGWSGIALLDGVLFVINAGEVVFRSASIALVPAVVPRSRLERARRARPGRGPAPGGGGRSGRRWPRDSAGWRTSGCCAP
jgi:MFS family permease